MGRKATDKERKPLNIKQQKWLADIMPYFYKNGVRKPTMDDIAEHLNLSKATIYNYYCSKEDLIHDALWFKLVELQKFRDLLFDESVEFTERYYLGARFFTASLKGMSALYLEDLKNYFPKIWADVDLFREKSAENIKTYYQNILSKFIYSFSGVVLFNCSHINENDQFALFKSTTSPLSVIKRIVNRSMFTGPKYERSWFCNVPPNSTYESPDFKPDTFIGTNPKTSFT